jgi:hypothetical protein
MKSEPNAATPKTVGPHAPHAGVAAGAPTAPSSSDGGAGERAGWRWTARRLLAALLGGWLAIGLLCAMLHLLLAASFPVIDLFGLLAAGGWTVVVLFVGIFDH